MAANYRIIQAPWLNYLCQFVRNTKQELLILAPFFSLKIIQKIVGYANEDVRLHFLLGANTRGIASGASDYEALIFLHEQTSQRDVVVKNIPNLHAKVIISDQAKAIVSSSNFTGEGLQRNIEFGIELDGEPAKQLCTLVRKYWDQAEVLTIGTGVGKAREALNSFQEKQRARNQEIPEMPLGLGKRIDPKGSDLSSAPLISTRMLEVSIRDKEKVINPDDRTNLLFNVWWNDNKFKGPCLDISTKTVCRNYFIKRDGKDRTKECETQRNGCDSAYIFSNYAYYVNTDLDNKFLNKCAFFIARNPNDDRYWMIGSIFINKKGTQLEYVTEGGRPVAIPRYIQGDATLSLEFQPYLIFDEAFIQKLSLGKKWGKRDTSEASWITHHTRSRASCTYIGNADAVAILETYKKHTKNPKHMETVSIILEKHYYK